MPCCWSHNAISHYHQGLNEGWNGCEEPDYNLQDNSPY